jgi:hypothetical protein
MLETFIGGVVLYLIFVVLDSMGYGWILYSLLLLIFIPIIIYYIYDWLVGGNLFQRTFMTELDEEWEEELDTGWEPPIIDWGEEDDDKPIREREPISQTIKDQVWNRDGGKCVECGSNEKIEFDHIIPFSKGGSNTYRNLQILCEKCNRSKSDKIG